MIYEQSHYWTEPYDGYEYDIGWTQRLVIKVTKLDAKASLTVPTYIAASCEVGSSTAQVQYVIRGLSGSMKNLTGDAKTFNVDQYAQYAVKMQGLLDEVDSLKMNIEPLVIAQGTEAGRAADEPSRSLSRLRLSAVGHPWHPAGRDR